MNRLKQAWYWPMDEDEEILRLSDSRPCKAVVTNELIDGADLLVTDHFGNFFVRLSVPFVRPHTHCDRCELVA